MNKIMVDNKTNLVDYPYFLKLNIRDIYNPTKKTARQTRVANQYDI